MASITSFELLADTSSTGIPEIELMYPWSEKSTFLGRASYILKLCLQNFIYIFLYELQAINVVIALDINACNACTHATNNV